MVLSYTRCVDDGYENFPGQYASKYQDGVYLKRWPGIHELLSESKRQLRALGALAALNFIWIGRFAVCTFFLGYLGGQELAAGSLALTYANLTGFSILLGLSGGLESLISQAFGAQREDVLFSSLYKTILLLLLASVPSGLAWLGVETFLLYLGYNPSVAALAGRFLLYLLPDLVLQAVLYPLGVFLRCQLKIRWLLVLSSLGFLLHIVLCFIFVVGLRLKGAGTALAVCVSDFVILLLLLVSVFNDARLEDKDSKLTGTLSTSGGPLLELAFPSCVTIWLEWWCFEIIVLLAGLLEDPEKSISRAVIVLNGDTFFYVLQMTLASCACNRVGYELGTNSPASAYHAAVSSILSSLLLGGLSFVCMATFGLTWGSMFSTNSEVVKAVGRDMRVMGLVELVSFPVVVCSGILRGCGVPTAGAAARLVSFYVIGLPLSLVLGVVLGVGSLGLMYGLLAGVVCCAAMTGVAVCGLDWVDLALCTKQQFCVEDEELDDLESD